MIILSRYEVITSSSLRAYKSCGPAKSNTHKASRNADADKCDDAWGGAADDAADEVTDAADADEDEEDKGSLEHFAATETPSGDEAGTCDASAVEII